MNKLILFTLLFFTESSLFVYAKKKKKSIYRIHKKDNKCYHVNIFGERISEAIYDDNWYGPFWNNDTGWIIVKRNDLYGVLNIQGIEVLPCIYEDITAISNKDSVYPFFVCRKDGKYGIISIENSIVVPFIYDYIYSKIIDNVILCRKEDKSEFLNINTWKTTSSYNYDGYIENDSTDLITVIKNGCLGYINTKGEIVIPLIHSIESAQESFETYFAKDGYAVLQNLKTGIWSCYNKKGKRVEIGKYDKVESSKGKRILVKKNGKYGFVNSETGKLVIPCIYDFAYNYFEDGVAIVSQKSKGDGCALISKSGILLTDFFLKRPWGNEFVNGLYTGADITGRYGAINNLGDIVIPFKYECLWSFNNDGYAIYFQKNKQGIINKSNEIVIPAICDDLKFGRNLFQIKKDGKWSLVNCSNQAITPLTFDYINNSYDNDDGLMNFEKNGKYGYITPQGDIVALCEKEDSAKLLMDQWCYSQIPSDIDCDIPLCNPGNRNVFALIMSNENYLEEDIPDVNFSISDGKSFKEYCTRTLGIPLRNIKYLQNATLNQMRSGINWICDNAIAFDGEASIIVYYSGHGMPNEKNGNAYLLPADGSFKDYRTAIGIDDTYKQLGEISIKQTTIFLDACFSGTSKDGKTTWTDSKGITVKAKPTQLQGNMIVFAAAQGDETAHLYKKKKHSMFTYFLLKKLKETKGEVSLGDLGTYINKQVRQNSVVENGKIQSPTVSVSNNMSLIWSNLKLK